VNTVNKFPLQIKIVLILQLFANMSNLQVTAYFPRFLEENELPPYLLGYIMSCDSVFDILAAWATGEFLLKHMVRLNAFYLGILLLIIN
jgi:hypothetical protein